MTSHNHDQHHEAPHSHGHVDEDMLFVVHEVDMNETGWLHLKSAITWAPNVGFVASSTECPVLRRALKCLDERRKIPTDKRRRLGMVLDPQKLKSPTKRIRNV